MPPPHNSRGYAHDPESLGEDLRHGWDSAVDFVETAMLRVETLLAARYPQLDREVVRDEVRETFSKYYLSISTETCRHLWSGRASFTTWLFACARNRCRELLRRMQAHPAVSIETGIDPAVANLPDSSYDVGDTLFPETRIHEVLDRLPSSYRGVLELVAEGYSSKDIAEELHMKIAAVYVLVHRARVRAKSIFASMEDAT